MVRIYDMLANNDNYGSKRDLKDIRYIIIHSAKDDNINGTSDFQKNDFLKSVHYYVNKKSVNRCVKDEFNAFSIANPTGEIKNSNSISIMISNTESQDVLNIAAQLINEKMNEFNIDINNVVRHYDIDNSAMCPKVLVDDDTWENFKKSIIDNE